ncbi:MAG TPA: hypothetical protein VJA21_14480 [Verrucomicrobiae bacterium]
MWSCLETNAGLDAVSTVWRHDLGHHFPAFQAAFLRRSAEPARSYPCPHECGCAHEVIQHAPEDIVAVCRCDRWNCDDFPLKPEDIVAWGLSWQRLGSALCRALSLAPKMAELGLPNTRQIGAWSATAVPVMLIIESDARQFRHTLIELTARLQHPFILLAPTARHLTAPSLELLGRVQAGFFDLGSSVRLLPGGTLQAVRAPGEIFQRFTAPPRIEEQSVVQRAFALAKALDTATAVRGPGALAVFTSYCLDGLTVTQIARKLGCSRGTVLNRLELIGRRAGIDPDRLRKISPQIQRIEDQLSDPRAARIYRPGLANENEDD